MRYLFIAIIVLLTFSCKKAKIVPNEFSFMEGKYKWSYSDGYIPKENDPDFSLVIESSGNIYTYEDGKKVYKHKIGSYGECEYCTEDQSVVFSTYTKKGTKISGSVLVLDDGTALMILKGFPFGFDFEKNYFYRYE